MVPSAGIVQHMLRDEFVKQTLPPVRNRPLGEPSGQGNLPEGNSAVDTVNFIFLNILIVLNSENLIFHKLNNKRLKFHNSFYFR